MTPKELKDRTEEFARVVVAFCAPLLERAATRDLAGQLIRSGSGLDANYGSAQMARSPKEFVAKLGQVLDDANESSGWLRLLTRSKLVGDRMLPWLQKEADELTRIFAKSYQTAKANYRRRTQDEKASRARKTARRVQRMPPTDR